MTYTAHEVLGGIYEKTVKVTVDRRLRYAPYSQAGWIDRTIKPFRDIPGTWFERHTLYSYSSRILYADTSKVGGAVDLISTELRDAAADCSRTTSRHVTLALRELGLSDRVTTVIKRFLTEGTGTRTAVYDGAHWLDEESGEVIA